MDLLVIIVFLGWLIVQDWSNANIVKGSIAEVLPKYSPRLYECIEGKVH